MKKIILLLGFVVFLAVMVVGTDRSNDVIVWSVVSNSPSRSSDVIIFSPEAVGASAPCTYSGSGDFSINCSSNCEVNVETDLGGNDVFITGEGVINVTAIISNYSEFHIRGNSFTNRCEVHYR